MVVPTVAQKVDQKAACLVGQKAATMAVHWVVK
jgi:hypothetical protein